MSVSESDTNGADSDDIFHLDQQKVTASRVNTNNIVGVRDILVGLLKPCGQAPFHHPRTRFHHQLSARWPDPGYLDLASVTFDEVEPSALFDREYENAFRTAQTIARFVGGCGSAEKAFERLSGRRPSHPMQWDVRHYGVAFIGSRDDLRILGLPDNHRGMASSHMPILVPEMQQYVCLVADDTDTWPTILEHEFVHMRIKSTTLAENTEKHLRHFGNTEYVLSRLWNPDDAYALQTAAVSEYCNSVIREELAANLLTTPERLAEEPLPPMRGETDRIYLYGSAEYPPPYLFRPYTFGWPPGSQQHLPDRKLVMERKRELGPPFDDPNDGPAATEAQRNMRAKVFPQCDAVDTKYGKMYQHIVRNAHAALNSGLEREELLNIIIDTPFERIADTLQNVIGQQK